MRFEKIRYVLDIPPLHETYSDCQQVNKNLQDGSVEPSRVLAQQAWNLAQSDEITAQGHDAGLNEMTYAEWLEVIARFAVVQYPKEETLDAALARRCRARRGRRGAASGGRPSRQRGGRSCIPGVASGLSLATMLRGVRSSLLHSCSRVQWVARRFRRIDPGRRPLAAEQSIMRCRTGRRSGSRAPR